MTERITMSRREVDRLGVIQAVADRRLRQREAARQLGLSTRQVKRLVRDFRERGPAGLISGHRGRPSNNAIPAATRAAVLALVRERYADFGPTLACEKLADCHGFTLSTETLRQFGSVETRHHAATRSEMRSTGKRSSSLPMISGPNAPTGTKNRSFQEMISLKRP